MRSTKAFFHTTLALFLLIAACGNPAPEESQSDMAATETESSAPSSGTEDNDGMINAFSLAASGGATASWEGGGFSLVGGCTPSQPMSMGFLRGTLRSEELAQVAFDSADPIDTGETGTFALKEIRWDNGIVAHSIPGGGEVSVPNRFTGTGTLVIETHNAAVNNRQLAGTVTGTVSNDDGVSADLVVEFDIDLSCGVSL
jgi:hypothetical protein